jgi:hypothetical protein
VAGLLDAAPTARRSPARRHDPAGTRRRQPVVNVFLSFRYDDAGKQLARLVEDLLESHSLRATTGDVLGGEILTPEIQRQIEDADALVALLTRRDQLQNGSWTTHPFCLQELQHARGKGKPAVAIVEDGVAMGGFEQQYEYIPYNAEQLLPTFLKLSRTIRKWKQRVGRTIKIQVEPPDVAQEVWVNRANCVWEYRLSSGLRETEWQATKARREANGLFVFVQVPDDTWMIEVRARSGKRAWVSDATPFLLPVRMTEE